MTGRSPAIECDGLVRQFGELVAVDGLSFRVESGQFFALLGPNGAGKSSTLHVLTTLRAPTAGSARVLGFDVRKQAAEIRARIGMVFQEPALDDRLTARENLRIHASLYAIPRAQCAGRISSALEWASLERMADRPVRTFSGGMKRRLELARALMHEPDVLFLDEPTLGLDPQGRRHLWADIDALRTRGITIFMTTHYLSEAEGCDRVAILDGGRVVGLGSPADLKQEVLKGEAGGLEEVFLTLTGKDLRDEEASPRARMLGFARRGGEHTR